MDGVNRGKPRQKRIPDYRATASRQKASAGICCFEALQDLGDAIERAVQAMNGWRQRLRSGKDLEQPPRLTKFFRTEHSVSPTSANEE
jgi:hypothetical protein